MVVENRRSQIHKPRNVGRFREHPAFAERTEVMLRLLLQTTQNRLAFRYPKTLIRQRKREREGTRRHFLTAGAMTDSREQRWARYLHTHAPAAAAAAPGKFPIIHP